MELNEGRLLRIWVDDHYKNQGDFPKEIGYSRQHISKLFKRKKLPSIFKDKLLTKGINLFTNKADIIQEANENVRSTITQNVGASLQNCMQALNFAQQTIDSLKELVAEKNERIKILSNESNK